MLKPHQYSIGGLNYATTPLPAGEALVFMPRIIRLLGKELTALWLMSDEKASEGARGIEALLEDREVMARAISTISENAVNEEGGLGILREIMRYTVVELVAGEVPVKVLDVFDNHFAGDPLSMMSVAAHALRSSFTRPSAG